MPSTDCPRQSSIATSKARCGTRRCWSWPGGPGGRCRPQTRACYRYDSLDGFLWLFWLAQSCLETREDWARLAYESVVDGAAHGVVYRESFFTPARHLAEGQDLATIVAGLEDGLAAGEAETGTRVMLVCHMDRACGGDAGLELVKDLVGLKPWMASRPPG